MKQAKGTMKIQCGLSLGYKYALTSCSFCNMLLISSQTRDLGKLMPYVTQYMIETLSSWEALEQLPDVIPRANSILLVCVPLSITFDSVA